MKWAKRIGLTILLLFLFSLLFSWFYLQSIKPDYNENRRLSKLVSNVEVIYDNYGVPHIYADTEKDAVHALGYVHAKDRLWQMELLRRIAPGRLSEVFGSATLGTDKFFRHLQIHQSSIESTNKHEKNVDPSIRLLIDAYISGINEYVASDDTPIEYKILGIEKTPFTVTDIYNVMGYMAFSFAMAHKTEPVTTFIANELGPEYLEALDIHVDSPYTMIQSDIHPSFLQELSHTIQSVSDVLPVPPLVGSNSWVVGPEKTNTGEVIFANDPHIGFSQPAVWYEAHIETPQFSHYGNYLAGYPFPQMGHNDQFAIGLTMYENDDIDFYKEYTDDDHPGQYFHNGEWKPIESSQSIIKVKGEEDVAVILKRTVHGPVISEETNGFNKDQVVSMWWTYQHKENQLFEAIYKITHAQSMLEVQDGVSLIAAPGLNVMYGDKDGNVAWWAAAHLPIRPSHVNSKLILDGRGEDDVEGFYDFMDNPMAINPEWNYVYSANNQSIREGQPKHPGYYLPEDRAKRIVNLLEDKNDWSVEDIKQMLLDNTSTVSSSIAEHLISQIDKSQLDDTQLKGLESIATWDGSYDNQSIAPIIYTKWLHLLTKHLVIDELGEDHYRAIKGTHLFKRSYHKLLSDNTHPWWDDITTVDQKETSSDLINTTFQTSIKELTGQLGTDLTKWKWTDIHTLEHPHALGQNETLRKYFNVGPFGVESSNETINNLMFSMEEDGTYEVHAGPSCRRVVDFSNVRTNSWSILPTGQSGRVMSDHFKDQASMYANGQYRKKLMDREEIIANKKHQSLFTPE